MFKNAGAYLIKYFTSASFLPVLYDKLEMIVSTGKLLTSDNNFLTRASLLVSVGTSPAFKAVNSSLGADKDKFKLDLAICKKI